MNNSWVTIGTFDGVHLGHQEIVRQMAAGARNAGAPSVVITFYPHPGAVLGKRSGPFYLTTPEQRAAFLAKAGADVVITHPFNRTVAQISAYDFMKRIKVHLGIQKLWVGHDFALGRGREGDIPRLREIGSQLGYSLHVIDALRLNGEIVSSSQIRAALASGEIERANRMLGRPYCLKGEVIHGDGRGKTIGVPTANLDTWAEQALPEAGVYVCEASVLGKEWGAVANVGYRPTFENQPARPQVEAHLLDLDRDLYGRRMELRFLKRLREERRFANIDALVSQIRQDIQDAETFLKRREGKI